MEDGTATTQVAEEGSLNWYMRYGGGFVHTLLQAVKAADWKNLERLRLAFPQVVAAREMPDWYRAPSGFAPNYKAEAATDTIEVPPDRNTAAMVKTIIAHAQSGLDTRELLEAHIRFSVIEDTATRLLKALEAKP